MSQPIAGAISFPSFTPIASRPRSLGKTWARLEWCEHQDAALTMKQAHELADAGHLILASRHFPDRVECVVKSVGAKRAQ